MILIFNLIIFTYMQIHNYIFIYWYLIYYLTKQHFSSLIVQYESISLVLQTTYGFTIYYLAVITHISKHWLSETVHCIKYIALHSTHSTNVIYYCRYRIFSHRNERLTYVHITRGREMITKHEVTENNE